MRLGAVKMLNGCYLNPILRASETIGPVLTNLKYCLNVTKSNCMHNTK